MSVAAKLKQLRQKADRAFGEHQDEIKRAASKAQTVVDRRTGGKYHDRIAKAGAKFDSNVTNSAPTASGRASNRSEQPTPRAGG